MGVSQADIPTQSGKGSCLSLFIPPTLFIHPDIQSMMGYIVFAFPFIRTYVRLSSRHRVKVFALKYIRPQILKTL